MILNKEEITNKKLGDKLKKQNQNISKVTNKLLDMCAIKVKKTEGKQKFFSVEHSIRWFLLENEIHKKSNKKQNDISKKI